MTNIAIFHTDSPGLRLDARIISAALSRPLEMHGARVLFVEAPLRALDHPPELIRRQFPVDVRIDISIFLERAINHPVLQAAHHRILVPNPEWLFGQSAHLAKHCTAFWHKSRFSLNKLAPLFPQARHDFIGFTSSDPGAMVRKHTDFLHLRGNLATRRHSGLLTDLWQTHPEWPDLYTQLHGGDLDISLRKWLSSGNIHLRLGWLTRDEYVDTAATHGIHICTSEHEGFGHYINESRAMGALVITTDAPPMNELIDSNSGILVATESNYARAFGTGFKIGGDALKTAIEQALSLSAAQRRELGMNARARFESELIYFNQYIRDVISSVLS